MTTQGSGRPAAATALWAEITDLLCRLWSGKNYVWQFFFLYQKSLSNLKIMQLTDSYGNILRASICGCSWFCLWCVTALYNHTDENIYIYIYFHKSTGLVYSQMWNSYLQYCDSALCLSLVPCSCGLVDLWPWIMQKDKDIFSHFSQNATGNHRFHWCILHLIFFFFTQKWFDHETAICTECAVTVYF